MKIFSSGPLAGRKTHIGLALAALVAAGADRDAIGVIGHGVQTERIHAVHLQFGGNALFPDPGINGISLSQNNTTTGAIARAAFDLVFKCRIGG